jgi:hypothetical protein
MMPAWAWPWGEYAVGDQYPPFTGVQQLLGSPAALREFHVDAH